MGGEVKEHEVELVGLKPDNAREFFSEIAPFVAQFLARDPWNSTTVADVRDQLVSGVSLCIIHAVDGELRAITVAQLYDNALGEIVLHVLGTAGEGMEIWLDDLIEYLKKAAGNAGAVAVTLSGRLGWAKRLRRYGFQPIAIDMRLPIEHEQAEVEQPAIIQL